MKEQTQESVPGVIVGIWSPAGDYVRAFGVADKATRAPVKTDFYSRLGSETKTFTITALLQLVDDGKLSLDDPIAKYIDDIVNGDQVTLREMARMQSGLPSYTFTKDFQKALFADPHQSFTPQELVNFVAGQPAVFPPGEGWQYSNTNTVLLGMVIEKVSGKPLQEFFKERIFTPLKMSDTIFATNQAFPEPHAQGYTVDDTTSTEQVATDWNPSWGWAAGSMISTLDDLHIWAPAMATGKLLKPETQAQRLQTVPLPKHPPEVGYGLGLFNIYGWIGHNGSLPGYQSVTMYLPEKDTTVVLLINTDTDYNGAEPSTGLATAITQVITPNNVYSLSGNVVHPTKSGG
ncbi:MAG TPA: serine hydrolase domain-containing protein [Acidimicrobiales bacterium]|nr:serine hydrolase domain-containing protein [Acidimicrobiales bacterium]